MDGTCTCSRIPVLSTEIIMIIILIIIMIIIMTMIIIIMIIIMRCDALRAMWVRTVHDNSNTIVSIVLLLINNNDTTNSDIHTESVAPGNLRIYAHAYCIMLCKVVHLPVLVFVKA
jgi:hypothetical protein